MTTIKNIKTEILKVEPIKISFETPKDETLETPKTTSLADATDGLMNYLEERFDKLIKKGMTDIKLTDLIIRNREEYIAVKALREKHKRDEVKHTQKLLNKFKSVF
jgi:hypothetical protein